MFCVLLRASWALGTVTVDSTRLASAWFHSYTFTISHCWLLLHRQIMIWFKYQINRPLAPRSNLQYLHLPCISISEPHSSAKCLYNLIYGMGAKRGVRPQRLEYERPFDAACRFRFDVALNSSQSNSSRVWSQLGKPPRNAMASCENEGRPELQNQVEFPEKEVRWPLWEAPASSDWLHSAMRVVLLLLRCSSSRWRSLSGLGKMRQRKLHCSSAWWKRKLLWLWLWLHQSEFAFVGKNEISVNYPHTFSRGLQ